MDRRDFIKSAAALPLANALGSSRGPVRNTLVHESFDPAVHVIQDLQVPENCIHKRAIDWGSGPHNPFCILWGAKTSNGVWFIYDEFYTTESNTWKERISDIHTKDGWGPVVQRPEWPSPGVRATVYLPLPRWRYDLDTFRQTYAPSDQPALFAECGRYQLPVTPVRLPPNSYSSSIKLVCLHFELQHVFIDGHRCPNLIRELQTLRWQHAEKSLMQVRVDDHATDALRLLLFADSNRLERK